MENPLGRFLAHSALLRHIADFKGAFKRVVVAPYTNGDSLMSAIALIPLLILPFSPFLAFFIGLAIILTFAEAIGANHRRILAISVIIAASFLNGDFRLHGDSLVYFSVYDSLLNGNLKAIFYFGNGFEIGLPLTYLVLGKILGNLEPAHFLALNIFLTASLFYVWLEKYALTYIKDSQKALCVAFALMFFNYTFAHWLVRQDFSSIFILYALASKKWQNALIFSIIATAFHASAVFFLIVGFLLVYRPKIGMLLCVGIALIFYNFKDITEAVHNSGVNNPIFTIFKSKFYYYIISQTAYEKSISIGFLLMQFYAWIFWDTLYKERISKMAIFRAWNDYPLYNFVYIRR